MSKSTHSGKIFIVIVLLFVAAVAGLGYYSFTDTVDEEETATASTDSQATDDAAPAAQASTETVTSTPTEAATSSIVITDAQVDDILFGKVDAPVTIIDYSSLSCPHCALFHKEVLPKLTKEFITTGKAKLIFRHFPLNEPALRAAQLVNCADAMRRIAFIATLFEKQGDWAYTESFLKELKPLAAVNGIDSAAFDSCLTDKAGETRIIEVRKVAAESGQVSSTPSFFIDGVLMQGTPTLENFRAAIKK